MANGNGQTGTIITNGGMVPVSEGFLGIGVPEPPASMVAKTWKFTVTNRAGEAWWIFFYKLIDGRIMCYNSLYNSWKIWRPKKMIVISPDPRLSTITRLERTYMHVISRLAAKSRMLNLARIGPKADSRRFAHGDHDRHGNHGGHGTIVKVE